jgi:hypothetical protein
MGSDNVGHQRRLVACRCNVGQFHGRRNRRTWRRTRFVFDGASLGLS